MIFKHSFVFGLIDQVYYDNKEKRQDEFIKLLKKYKNSTIEEAVKSSVAESELRTLAFYYLKGTPYYYENFSAEMKSYCQLIEMFRYFKKYKIRLKRKDKKVIKKWLLENLKNKEVMGDPNEIKKIFKDVGLKGSKKNPNEINQIYFNILRKSPLPRDRALKMQVDRLTNGCIDLDRELECIDKYEISIKEIKGALYRVDEPHKIELVKAAVKFSSGDKIKYLSEIFKVGLEEVDNLFVGTKQDAKIDLEMSIIVDYIAWICNRDKINVLLERINHKNLYYLGEITGRIPRENNPIYNHEQLKIDLTNNVLSEKMLLVADRSCNVIQIESIIRNNPDKIFYVWFVTYGNQNFNNKGIAKNSYYFYGDRGDTIDCLIRFITRDE